MSERNCELAKEAIVLAIVAIVIAMGFLILSAEFESRRERTLRERERIERLEQQ